MKSEKLKVKNIELKNGAVIIADVHYRKGDTEFLILLKKWIKNPPPQVFLLGDIFHLLLPFKYLVKYNKEAVELINILATKTEVYYTPGNHDFNIKKVFPEVTVFDAFYDEKKNVFLTHGDLTDSDLSYKIYVSVIRNRTFNVFLNFFSLNFLNNWLFKKILQKKIDCTKIKNFEKKIKEKTKKLDYDIIIEGHYHQNEILHFHDKTYISLPAFVCTKSYILIQLDNNPIIKEIDYDGR
ncbi:metallophosphoesterase [Nautilia profundicola AmH]|uniref:Metallophosphoesterase n=1 Tax=Nautilia profundicola (strain ATCC BAA-1463 / DSM 18972 / AmH) TaxID=598659 RepID=B9L825_NAUPA|nr:UDP-2,3-diacylglucosamine diphosphatase [Nautilia profundicola]ACM92975.1 metallophosphoesterase [Nautilia profundicola AmH]